LVGGDTVRRSKEAIKKEIETTQKRLDAYLEREDAMLSPEGVQQYAIGSRSLTRYSLALADVQKMIEQLRKRLIELEAELKGQKPRKAVGIVPRDW